jgi:hypothetical protein
MKPTASLLLLFLVPFSSFHRTLTPTDQLSSALTSYFKNYPEEKIYVQTDKPVYLSSQTIWFKMYCTAYGGPSTLSKVAYLQLVDHLGNVVVCKKMAINQGVAQGDIQLPDSLPSNAYQLRGFTAWMLNFEESGLLHKNVFVCNYSAPPGTGQPVRKAEAIKHYHLQFFPEGGDPVEGLNSNIAFKATDEFGMPAQVQGTVVDETGASMAHLITRHDGMGVFDLRPSGEHQYTGIVHFPDNSVQEIPLPGAKPFGVVLKITEQSTDNITLRVTYREQQKGQYQHLSLASFQNNGKVVVYPIELDPGINLFSIHKKDFSSGILRLTLFDDRAVPLAERILFLDNNDRINAQLVNDTLSFEPKAKSAFTLNISDAFLELDHINLSVSVTDADRIQEDSLSENIVSSLLLSSELKGYIYNPGYYVRNTNEQTQQGLDLVMLTNGWRHFTWKQILDSEVVVLPYAVEKSLFVAGQIIDYNKYKSKIQPELKLIIRNQDNSQFMGQATPDSNGKFLLNDYNANGQSMIYFESVTKDNRDKNLRVRFFTSPVDSLEKVPVLEVPPSESGDDFSARLGSEEETQIQNAHKFTSLKSVLVRGYVPNKTEMVARRYVSPEFQTAYYHDADLVNTFYPNSLRLFDFIRGRFAGLWVDGTEDNPKFYLRAPVATELHGPSFNKVNQGDEPDAQTTSIPYFYINEIRSSFENAKDIPLSDIALIRYIPPPAPMAPMNGGFLGVVCVYLKKWDENMVHKGIDQTYGHAVFHGFSIAREFAEPDYSRKDSLYMLSDYRTTLYWNPNLVADKQGKIHFSFFNSDHAKAYRIVVEGMDNRGRLAYINTVIAAP